MGRPTAFAQPRAAPAPRPPPPHPPPAATLLPRSHQVKRAPRIDLNCGCPANTVTGNGAGSSLLRTPQRIHDIVSAMVAGVRASAAPHTPVSVKLRAGFDDTSLFEDNLLAAQVGAVRGEEWGG